MERKRIDNVTAIFMISVAVCIDLLQGGVNLFNIVPVFGLFIVYIAVFFINIGTGLCFYLWFKMHDVVFVDSVKKFTVRVILPFFEFLPIANILPLWTLSVWLMIMIVQHDDRIGSKKLERNLDRYYQRMERSAR